MRRRYATGLMLAFWAMCAASAAGQEFAPEGTILSPEPAAELLPPSWLAPGCYLAVDTALVNVRRPDYQGDAEDGGWTVSPRAAIGYQFESGRRLEAAYRFVTGGGGTRFDDPLGYFNSSQDWAANLHLIDLMAHTAPWAWSESGRFRMNVGARLAAFSEDHTFASTYRIPSGPGPESVMSEGFGFSELNWSYFGAGPRTGAEVACLFGDSGISAFARADGAVLFGGSRTKSSYASQFGGAGFSDDSFYTSDWTDLTTYTFSVEAGLAWTRAFESCLLTLQLGYVYQEFGFLGQGFENWNPACTLRYGGPFAGAALSF